MNCAGCGSITVSSHILRLIPKSSLSVLAFLVPLFLSSFVGVALAHTPSPQICDAATCNIDLHDNFFQPAIISIKAPNSTTGESVTLVWQNHGFQTHTVTSGRRGASDGIFDRTLSPGGVFQLVINQTVYSKLLSKYPDGVVPYHCIPHFGMDATLVIRAETTSEPPKLTVLLSLNPTTVNSEAEASVTVYVTNGSLTIEGALVQLSSDKGGIFSPQSGNTDSGGKFDAVFKAPQVISQASANITATASKDGYSNGLDFKYLIVYPPDVTPSPTLSVTVTANPSTIQSSQTSTITATVTSNGVPVSGATVTLESDKGGIFAQTSGTTDSYGYFTTTLTAPNVETQTSVGVTANATKTGYLPGESQIFVTVNPTPSTEGEQSTGNLWIYLAIVVVVLIGIGGGIAVAVAVVKRRSSKAS